MLTIASVVAMASIMFSSTLVNSAFAEKDSDVMHGMDMGLVLKVPSALGQLSPEKANASSKAPYPKVELNDD